MKKDCKFKKKRFSPELGVTVAILFITFIGHSGKKTHMGH